MQRFRELVRQYKVSLLILGSFLAVLIIGIAAYSWQEQQNAQQAGTSEQNAYNTLQELEASSKPVTQSEEEQLKTLKSLEANSKKVSASSSVESQVKVLQALEGQSKQ